MSWRGDLARAIRAIPISLIYRGLNRFIFKNVGGIPGRILSWFAPSLVSRFEKWLDKKLEGVEKYEKAAESIAKEATQKAERIQNAKSDEELDEAFRDSLR